MIEDWSLSFSFMIPTNHGTPFVSASCSSGMKNQAVILIVGSAPWIPSLICYTNGPTRKRFSDHLKHVLRKGELDAQSHRFSEIIFSYNNIMTQMTKTMSYIIEHLMTLAVIVHNKWKSSFPVICHLLLSNVTVRTFLHILHITLRIYLWLDNMLGFVPLPHGQPCMYSKRQDILWFWRFFAFLH